MFQPVFDGENFSYFYEEETEQYLLIRKDEKIHIILKDEDALSFQEYIAMINSEPFTNIKERTEKAIRILFHFHHSCPIPNFIEL
jgi:hypothetical protein